MTLRPLLFSTLAAFSMLAALPANALTLYSGDLIKTADRPDVYYFGADNKRYVFPNEKTFYTWFNGFTTVTLTDTQLAQIAVGGAVTYRPGLKMVKITTDPKVYAVSKGGTLRWITTEALAASLYGANWATQVQDLPDAFFATYKVGTAITSVSDYSPSAELTAVGSIDADRGLIAAPIVPSNPPATSTPPTATSTVAVSPSKSPALAGDTITITGTATDPSGISKIDLFFDNVLIKSCAGATSCAGDTQIPISGTKTSYELRAEATTQSATTRVSTVTLPIGNGISSLVSLIVMRPQIRQGQAGEAIMNADPGINVLRTDILKDGQVIRSCASGIRECRWSDTLSGALGTTYDFNGVVTDSLGRTYRTAHKTITIGTNDSPVVTVAPAKNLIYKNEMLDVTVSASDDDGIQQITVTKDGAILKTCTGAAPCTISTGPWTNAGTITFGGTATDILGLTTVGGVVSVTVQ